MVRVTSETLKHFETMLRTMPDIDNLDPASVQEARGLNVDLMPHQERTLIWMLWRESQDPPGGILADDMGLGKTLSMLSLILRHRELLKDGSIENFAMKNIQDEEYSSDDYEQKAPGRFSCNKIKKLKNTVGTLIVCPASLIGKWEKESKDRIPSGNMSVLVYHGTNRDTNVNRLCQYDLVVTTYQLAMIDKNSDGIPTVCRSDQGSLYQVGWARIILDEAHVVRNHKSQTFQAMCMLKGGRRWVVTGTPVHNKKLDIFSLIRFLRMYPFENYTCWKHEIQNNSAQGSRRFGMIVKAMMLRRTKDQIDGDTGKKLVELQAKMVVEHRLSLLLEERQIYDRVFTFSRSALIEYMKSHEQKEDEKESNTRKQPVMSPVIDVSEFTPTLNVGAKLDTGVKTHHPLVLLLRLRQVCCHPALIKAIVDEECQKTDAIDQGSVGLQMNLLAEMQNSHKETDRLEEEAKQEVEEKFFKLSNPVFDPSFISSKIERVIHELVKIKQKGHTNKQGVPDLIDGHCEKAVIVSQWTSMLQIVRQHLHESGIKTRIVDGSVPVKERTPIVNDFNGNPKGPKVLLLSLGAGGVGLNLIGGNHLFLLDMHWNPQLEAQACDRIYRVGQTRPVVVHRFVVENTVEQKILELQTRKLQLADDVLSGAKRRVENKLTLSELKELFNIA